MMSKFSLIEFLTNALRALVSISLFLIAYSHIYSLLVPNGVICIFTKKKYSYSGPSLNQNHDSVPGDREINQPYWP